MASCSSSTRPASRRAATRVPAALHQQRPDAALAELREQAGQVDAGCLVDDQLGTLPHQPLAGVGRGRERRGHDDQRTALHEEAAGRWQRRAPVAGSHEPRGHRHLGGLRWTAPARRGRG